MEERSRQCPGVALNREINPSEGALDHGFLGSKQGGTVVNQILRAAGNIKKSVKAHERDPAYYAKLLECYSFALNICEHCPPLLSSESGGGKTESVSMLKEKILSKIEHSIRDFVGSILGVPPKDIGVSGISKEITQFRDRLQAFRNEFFSKTFEGQEGSSLAKEVHAFWIDWLKSLFQYVFSIGSAPSAYAVVLLGSLAHGWATPYSDVEYIVLVEKEKAVDRMKAYSFLVEFMVLAIGESPIHRAVTELKLSLGEKCFETWKQRVLKGTRLDRHKQPTDNALFCPLIGLPKQLARQLFSNRMMHQEGNHLTASLLVTRPLEFGPLSHPALRTLYSQWHEAVERRLTNSKSPLGNLLKIVQKDIRENKGLHAKLGLGTVESLSNTCPKQLYSKLLHLVYLVESYYSMCLKSNMYSICLKSNVDSDMGELTNNIEKIEESFFGSEAINGSLDNAILNERQRWSEQIAQWYVFRLRHQAETLFLNAGEGVDKREDLEIETYKSVLCKIIARAEARLTELEREQLRKKTIKEALFEQRSSSQLLIDFFERKKSLREYVIDGKPNCSQVELSKQKKELEGKNFSGGLFFEARFEHSNLRGVNFSDTNLEKASLKKADLQDTNFYNANLEQVVLSGAKNLTSKQLKESRWKNIIARDSRNLKMVQTVVEERAKIANTAQKRLEALMRQCPDKKNLHNVLGTNSTFIKQVCDSYFKITNS